MRKIIAAMFITLDGVVEAPEKWNPPYYDDELNQAVMPRIASAGAHLYGRRSYELFRSVFTGQAAPPHAPLMTNTPKIVVSSTLDNPDWGPTTVINGDVGPALARLKEQPGRDITVGASGTLVRFLLRERLLDEFSCSSTPWSPARARGCLRATGTACRSRSLTAMRTAMASSRCTTRWQRDSGDGQQRGRATVPGDQQRQPLRSRPRRTQRRD